MPYHILLVDDDPCFRLEFKELMDEFDVIGVNNGQEALKVLKKPHNIDLIILDEMMPGIKGTDLLTEIKKFAPDIRSILLTGYCNKEVLIGALQAQATDFIEKPLNIQKIEKIRELVLRSPKGEKDKNVGGVTGKIEQAKYFAQRNYNKRLTLEDVADEVCLSPKYLSRLFKEHTGVIFSEYKLRLRMEKAKEILKNTGESVEEIAHQLGYQNPGSFIKVFHKFNKCTPRQFRDRNILQEGHKASAEDSSLLIDQKAIEVILTESMLKNSRSPVFIMDKLGKIVRWSPNAEKAYGWSESEVLGKSFSDISEEGLRDTATLRHLKNGQYIATLDSQRPTKQGRIINVCSTILPLSKKSKKFFVVIDQEASSAVDSEPRTAAGASKDLGQFLEQWTRRTYSLLRDDPSRSENVSERRELNIGRLAAMVAHELRHPLSVIQMAVWNMRKKGVPENIEVNLNSVEKMVKDGELIINNLLGYAHLLTPKFQTIPIYDFLSDVINSAKSQLPEIADMIELNFNNVQDASIELDRLLIKELLTDFIINASKTMPQLGQGKIQLNADIDNESLHIQLICKNMKSRSASKRRPSTLSNHHNFGGIENGVPITEKIIQLHHGDIHVDEDSDGSTIAIRLPLSGRAQLAAH